MPIMTDAASDMAIRRDMIPFPLRLINDARCERTGLPLLIDVPQIAYGGKCGSLRGIVEQEAQGDYAISASEYPFDMVNARSHCRKHHKQNGLPA
jgi:hypothetical protein